MITRSRISDGWANLLRGIGSTVSTAIDTVYSPDQPAVGSSVYGQLYETDWLAQKIVQAYPDDALRKAPLILGVSAEESKRLWAEYDRLQTSELYPTGVLSQGLYQGRALGGAAVLLGFATGGDPRKPAPEPGPRSSLAWIDACPWEWLTVLERETDANSPRFGLPSVYRVSGSHLRQGLEIHASRLILCEGLARIAPMRGEPRPWLSVLQPVYDAIKRFGLSWEAASLLLQESSVGVLKMAGLIDLLSTTEETAVRGRLQVLREGKSTARTIFLDAEHGEEFSRTEVSFTGVSPILEQLERQVCGAARIPAIKLFGRAAGGLSSTSDAEVRLYYDDVAVYQRGSVWPKQQRLLSLIAGRPVELEYPPIWEIGEREAAEVRKLNAESDRTYYDLGLPAATILESRSADGSLGITVSTPAELIEPEEESPVEDEPELPDVE